MAEVRKEVEKDENEEWAEADQVMPSKPCYHVFGIIEEFQEGHCDRNHLRGIFKIISISGDKSEH